MAIGGHHNPIAKTVEWLTPPGIIEALGPFDLDPCAPISQPYPTAAKVFTRLDNGLIQNWGEARVWLNPPYTSGEVEKWLGRMAEHDRGTALIFARTETEGFHRHVWERCSALLFLEGRINFHYPDGRRAKANAGAPSVLCAYGMDDADVLAYCGMKGAFVPLRIPRLVFVTAIEEPTWRDAVARVLEKRGPTTLADLYRTFASHPKAQGRAHWQAKIRQVLQEGPFRRLDRGLWEAAHG